MAKGFIDVIKNSLKPKSEILDMNGNIKLTDSSFWGRAFGSHSSSGVNVSKEKALRLSAVWSCVGLISDTIASLPLILYERLDDGGRIQARDHPLYDILKTSPNYNNTSFEFWQINVASLLLQGDGFSEVKKNSSGEIISLNFILPSNVSVSENEDGGIHYNVCLKNKTVGLSENRMMHLRGFSLDGITSLSPIRYGANVIGAAISADDAANSTFKNGLMPTVAFKVDRILKKDQRDEFREYVDTVSGAMNAGKSPVLEFGITPQQIGISPSDAQLLESRSFSIEEICRWFRVPPWMIGHTDKSTSWGSGMEQQMTGFATFTLNPWIVRIEQSINKHLLSPSDRKKYFAEFSLEGLLRADSETRSKFYSSMTQNGIYTRDECRVKENLPRKGGNADVLTIQTNLAPIDSIGQDK